MRSYVFGFVCVVGLSLACSAPAGKVGSTHQGDTTSLIGSWVLQGATAQALTLNPDGSFVRDRLQDAAFSRDTGTYDGCDATVTLHGPSGDELYTYTYTAAPVMNGIFLPGHAPTAKLALVGLDGTELDFKKATSWCVSSADCDTAVTQGTWTPTTVSGKTTCNVSANACAIAPADPVSADPAPTDTTAAPCSSGDCGAP